jgi:hypothetical protein
MGRENSTGDGQADVEAAGKLLEQRSVSRADDAHQEKDGRDRHERGPGQLDALAGGNQCATRLRNQ